MKKTLNLKKYQLKEKSERQRLRLYCLRKKLGLNQSREATANDTTVPITCDEHQQSTDSSESLKPFRTKQSLSGSIKKAEKALQLSPTKKRKLSMAQQNVASLEFNI